MAAGDIIVVNENSFAKKGNYFDGTDDYVLHDAHAVARVAANDTVGTYTAWIYLNDNTSQNTILSAGDNSSTNEFFLFYSDVGKLTIELNHGGGVKFKVNETNGSLQSRKWTHVAIVQNGTRPILYVNGKTVAMTDVSSTDLTFWYDELTLTDKFAIGVKESNNTHAVDFAGAIGQVKYFARAMSADEIAIEAGDGIHTIDADEIETALVFNITMEDDGITDSGSGADNGTLVGDAHYGGEISTYSQAMENNVTGHAAEDMNSFIVADRIQTIIKRGD